MWFCDSVFSCWLQTANFTFSLLKHLPCCFYLHTNCPSREEHTAHIRLSSAHIYTHTCCAQKLAPGKPICPRTRSLRRVFYVRVYSYSLSAATNSALLFRRVACNTPLHIITRDALIMPGHRKTICGAWEASPNRIFKIMRELHIYYPWWSTFQSSLWVWESRWLLSDEEICGLIENGIGMVHV